MNAQDALAINGEFGILEGKNVFSYTPHCDGRVVLLPLWAGNLGWEWRRVRTIQNEINELEKQVKPNPVTPEGTPVEAVPSPVELKIQQLTEERKELLKGSYRDRHFNAGSILLGYGGYLSLLLEGSKHGRGQESSSLPPICLQEEVRNFLNGSRKTCG
ncbi:hypothetical protein SLEP1_g2216 [Rubroshorea leprosula]|uniref:Uncharacterized protein n=1 Tax=Rubroshorea leprosula TaxID=152421 RepID=A0AAV5HNM7_9ROSI|nr:hypothetical protein SLEP1_g2216 [Rubroshorea leprosula]